MAEEIIWEKDINTAITSARNENKLILAYFLNAT